MKIVNSLKIAGLLIAAVSLSVGCAGTTEEEPAPAPQPTAEPEAPAEPMGPEVNMTQYTVVGGDNLWDISGKSDIYDNPYQWPLIYKQNSNQISDADLIYPGQVLEINVNPDGAEVEAAIRHAKTRGSWSVGVVEESDKNYLAQ